MKNGTNFTERELDIMSVLWKEGSGTVAEVKDELDDGAGYTTVLKMLQILEGKGMVRHKREGRAYRYSPLIAQDEAGSHALRRIVDKIFQGSAGLAVAKLVQDNGMSPVEIQRVRALLDEADHQAVRD